MKKLKILSSILILGLILYSGQKDEILMLKEKIIEIQNQGELGFKNFTLCSKVFSFASYVPLSESFIEKDGELLIYYEPANVFTSKREGFYEIWYTQDMELLNEKGEPFFKKEDALNFHYTSKSPVLDLFATNTITLTEVPAGHYIFRAVLKDKLRGNSVTKTINFEIR